MSTIQQPTPSQTTMNAHQTSFLPSPGIPALVSSDDTTGQSPAMIQAQAQAQQHFRQRQLLAYQQQQQIRQQQYLLQHQQAYTSVDTSFQPPLQAAQHPLVTKNMPAGLAPLNTNDLILTGTPTVSPSLLPSAETPIAKSASKGHSKQHPTGLAVLRLLQFAEQLSPGDQAQHRAFWDGFVSDFFTRSSQAKLGLRNSETDEQKAYYVSHYSTATFFHTLYECGVTSIQLTLEQTMEYVLPGGQMNVECPRANFIYRYGNGSLVTSTGHLWIRFSLTPNGIWKIKHFEFACQGNEEYISRLHLQLSKDGSKLKKSNKYNLLESSINVWGFPSRAYHVLQMLDAASRLDDLVLFSLVSGSTAKDSLNSMAYSMEQRRDTKDSLPANTEAPYNNTSDPTVKTDTMITSPMTTKKKVPKPSLTRRKSIKNDKVTDKSVDGNKQQHGGTDSITSAIKNKNDAGKEATATYDEGLESLVVRTQGGPSVSQQIPQQEYTQSHRQTISQQQQQAQNYHHQQQQQLHVHQQQQILLQMQHQWQQALGAMEGGKGPSSGLPVSQQQLQQLSGPLTPNIPHPDSLPQSSYPGSFGLPQQQHKQQQLDGIDEFMKSPQSLKRSHPTNDNNISPVSKKKGTSKTTSLK